MSSRARLDGLPSIARMPLRCLARVTISDFLFWQISIRNFGSSRCLFMATPRETRIRVENFLYSVRSMHQKLNPSFKSELSSHVFTGKFNKKTRPYAYPKEGFFIVMGRGAARDSLMRSSFSSLFQ